MSTKILKSLPDPAAQDATATYVCTHPDRYGPGMRDWALAYLRRRAKERVASEASIPQASPGTAA